MEPHEIRRSPALYKGNNLQFWQLPPQNPLEMETHRCFTPHLMFENILRALRFLLRGEFRRVWNEVHVRIYRPVWEFVFFQPSRADNVLKHDIYHARQRITVPILAPPNLIP